MLVTVVSTAWFMLCRWVWISVGYLIGLIIILHIVIIVAQRFLGPLDNSAAVLSEEALRVRDASLYGTEGKDGEVVVDVDEKVRSPKSHTVCTLNVKEFLTLPPSSGLLDK